MEIARITAIVSDLREALSKASSAFEIAVVAPQYRGPEAGDEWDVENANWLMEIVFLKLIVACDAIGLPTLRDRVTAAIEDAKKDEGGFIASRMGPDDPDAIWLSVARQHVAAIETLAQPQRLHAVTKDVTDILRAAAYTINNPKLFGAPPRNEDEVHLRLEGVLRCVFPDLKHKPMLTKPIKNYQPDTGLPSIRTLIEYKFVSDASVIPTIADQIFADTRGYHSTEWETFVYVIYETRRFYAEEQWQSHLESAGLGENSRVIVLSGEPPAEDQLPRARSSTRGAQPKDHSA